MTDSTVLVANRGEIAVRILAAAADLGLRTVAVHAADDAGSARVAQLHAVDANGEHAVAVVEPVGVGQKTK